MTKTAKATVELTKTEDGTLLNVEIGGKKASLNLQKSGQGPMFHSVLTEWAEAHFRPTGKAKKAIVVLSECLLAGFVTVLLLGVLAGAIWLIYNHAGAMAEGFGAAFAAGLLGGAVRYFRITRRLLHKLTAGKLFHD